MKRRTKVIFLFFSTVFFLCSFNSFAQEKPGPVKSAVLEKFMGIWVSEPYEFMGATWSDEANHYMSLNGQFMTVDIKGKNDKGESFSVMIFMRQEKDGTFKGWGFDDWGLVTNYTGTIKGDKVIMTGTSDWGSETREIEFTSGKKMVHNVTMKMKGKDGLETEMKSTQTYNKK